MLPAKLPSKQLQVIWYSVINSIIHQWWSGKCYCLLPKYLYLTRTWLKKYLMYLMSSKYSEYLNLYLYLQIWKSTCTWLKYFEKYLTPTLWQGQPPIHHKLPSKRTKCDENHTKTLASFTPFGRMQTAISQSSSARLQEKPKLERYPSKSEPNTKTHTQDTNQMQQTKLQVLWRIEESPNSTEHQNENRF